MLLSNDKTTPGGPTRITSGGQWAVPIGAAIKCLHSFRSELEVPGQALAFHQTQRINLIDTLSLSLCVSVCLSVCVSLSLEISAYFQIGTCVVK